MFRTYPDNYIPIPVKEYRSIETNVPHHPRYTVGMRHTTFRLADCEETYQKADIIARSVAHIKNPYFLKIP